jgi:hypothetical protein
MLFAGLCTTTAVIPLIKVTIILLGVERQAEAMSDHTFFIKTEIHQAASMLY